MTNIISKYISERRIAKLHEAIANGWDEEAERLIILHKVDVNGRELSGITPLHTALRHGCLEICEVLIKAGADVNARDDKGVTVLYTAVGIDRIRPFVIKLLLRAGADLTAINTEQNITALEFAELAQEYLLAIIPIIHSWSGLEQTRAMADRMKEVMQILKTAQEPE